MSEQQIEQAPDVQPRIMSDESRRAVLRSLTEQGIDIDQLDPIPVPAHTYAKPGHAPYRPDNGWSGPWD